MSYKVLRLHALFVLLFMAWGCYDYQRPPDSITVGPVQSPPSIPDGQFVLQIQIGEKYVAYKYDSSRNDEGYTEVVPVTTETIKKALDEVEVKYNIRLNEMSDQILLRGNPALKDSSFKFLKQAFKQKGIYKFRISTVPEPGNLQLPLRGEEDKGTVLKLKPEATVTFLLAAGNKLYYYEGDFNHVIKKTSYSTVSSLIKQYSKKIPPADLMFLIKADPEATFKNAIDILDEMVVSKVPAGHYAEVDITAEEKASIKNYKVK